LIEIYIGAEPHENTILWYWLRKIPLPQEPAQNIAAVSAQNDLVNSICSARKWQHRLGARHQSSDSYPILALAANVENFEVFQKGIAS
jgi:hypothetical protein